MPPGKLLLPRVSVVNGDNDAAVDRGGDVRDVALRDERRLDTFSGFWMHAITVKEFHRLRRWRMPDFEQLAVFLRNEELALLTQNFDRKRVEELVGENDNRNLRGQSPRGSDVIRHDRRLALPNSFRMIITRAVGERCFCSLEMSF